jgi:crotonobetainyl-CoA:carnitine CoA-transferase CaiB-like acyl-CoA transferase
MTEAPEVPQALEGVAVVDASGGVAGQFAGRVLAEHGARVVLVEPPGGSATRHPRSAEDRYLFRHLNSGKQSLVLDRATPQGQAAFDAMVAGADVLLTDSKEDLSPWTQRHPRLVACTIRDFAPQGPYAGWRGSEMIHQALSGLMHATGRAEREPLYGFGHRAYYSAGAAAVSAIVGALLARMRNGRGQPLDIRVHETAMAMSQNIVAQYSYNGTVQARGPYPGACDIFRCSDGWASMYCRGDRWPAFCAALGEPDLPKDPRFGAIHQLVRNWPEAHAILAPHVRAMTVDDFLARVQGARGLASRVHTMADVLACGHAAARRFMETVEEDGEIRPLLGPLFRMGGTPRRVAAMPSPLPESAHA